jgi:hypothetical protein
LYSAAVINFICLNLLNATRINACFAEVMHSKAKLYGCITGLGSCKVVA